MVIPGGGTPLRFSYEGETKALRESGAHEGETKDLAENSDRRGQTWSDKETEKKTDLGPCIQTYISNPMVKDTAQRAVWLGNDEVHYLRKWEDHDLQDLKELIQLVLTTIQGELIYSKMKLNMPKGKK